ncbi:MAG: protein kinase [Prosthecobacter sp.]|jgi:tRNA A-37 threonylcarbamoyl transferase component Bud32|uniref:protein kinase domain-containing protein n=1 Tax=Prosthecobacter sp. TaxID=1965333 RepID=UPI0019EAA4FE|nr:protein kinase [Prosthecobacter sp.]MBE2286143.1 protein kinase [Prosthecobacter sp.]
MSDPFHGLDPAGLMAAAAMPTDGDADTLPLQRADLPSLEEIAAAFPDLEILSLIGHGGMSAVFKARQPKLDRIVALKVLPKSLAATPGFAERFNREGRVLARLSHPSIVAVHDFGESGGFAYLIMEFVDGVNLRQAMRAGRFTPEQALRIIPAICDALQFAHTQGVLHRDIKPENILLDTSGRVKIADFGIAKILDEKGGDTLLTQSGAKLGTAPYMAPEQIEQPSSVDHRADIYSLGVVFYEMLTGELPLGRFAAPSELSSVGGNIDEIVFRALEKERTRRQQSVGEFKTQVEGAGVSRPSRRWNPGEPFEYKSKRKLCGLPVLHIVHGRHPATGKAREARGFFAFGDRAYGVFAFGGIARGIVAFGGFACGIFAIGGGAVGLMAFGGGALGLLFALGGLAVGTFSAGGLAIGIWAFGGQVLAYQGFGGVVNAVHEIKSLQAMPRPISEIASILSHWGIFTVVTQMTWPVSLALYWIVARWAHTQAAIEAGENPPNKDAPSVFWLLPALMTASLVFTWVCFQCFGGGAAGVSQLLIPTTISCSGLLLFLIALPLWLRLVPMNSFYGVRLPSTFASDQRWYEVNAVFGKHLFIWSLLVIGAGIAGFYQLPRHQDAYAWASITLTLVAVAASIVATLWWMHQHPVNAPARKKSRLMSWSGQAVSAVVIAMFIKSFIAAAYRCPNGSEPGVIKNSHWIASHLDTGFTGGDLILFQHESGQIWIARVVAREDKGLLLKRGGVAEEFFMPWDKIVGKMLFSHFSPDVIKDTGSSMSVPRQTVTEGTSKALDKAPVLRFTRIKRNGTDWQWPVYSADGKPLDDEESKRLIRASVGNGVESQNAEDCWLELWFEHPDFDRHSQLRIDVAGPDGQPLNDRDTSTATPGWVSTRPYPALSSCVISPGRAGKLPSSVQITLRYSIGLWRKGSVLPSDYNGSMSFGDGCLLAAFGDDSNHRAFVSWSKGQDDWMYDAAVRLKDGSQIGSSGWSRSGHPGKNIVESVSFPVLLREVESFRIRSRRVATITFPQVVIPPLP